METKKFLDQEGLTHFWKRLSMKDYPNNETLMAVINAIDETKADKSLLERYLSKEEYVAGESGGEIDLSFYLTQDETDELYLPIDSLNNYYNKNEIQEGYAPLTELSNYLTKIEAQNTYATLQQVYPIGAIYISVNSTNPSILFGFGNWQQIKDTFLLAAGDIYSAGSTGGEARHVLTIDEMPSHTHTYQRTQFNGNELGSDTAYGANNKTIDQFTGTSNATGGGIAHNNMPPYLTVYIWQRIE